MNKPATFRLRAEQARYLSDLIGADPVLADLVRSRPNICLGQDAIALDRSDAEALHDYFSDRMAMVGFDDSYEPNKEGLFCSRRMKSSVSNVLGELPPTRQ